MQEEEGPVVPDLSLEFVSQLIGEKVVSFTIKPGTAPGDNYMSILYCLKCIVKGEEGIEKTIYGISKCYPAHPVRQQLLNKSNIFWYELQIYKQLIPMLSGFREQMGFQQKLPFAPLISGAAINYGKGKENTEILAQYAGKVFSPFENYILMVDMKNTYGYRMSNRMVGLSLEEVSLVMAEHSKVHALSWAYKVKNGFSNYPEQYPDLEFEMNDDDMNMMRSIMNGSVQNAHDMLKSIDGVNPKMLDGILIVKDNLDDIMKTMFQDKHSKPGRSLDEMLRVKLDKTEEEKRSDKVPWGVIVHGDCWVNNLLFRYDEITKKAIELILVDLQLMREACPTGDLAYLFYTSTTAEFRRNHLQDMLKLYHFKFISYCDEFGVDYLPGFSLASLKRRFHASKLLGFMMALLVLPIILRDAKNIQDPEKFQSAGNGDGDLLEMFESMSGIKEENALLKNSIFDLATELFNEGVF